MTPLIYHGNVVLRRENLNGKLGVLDILAKLNNKTYCNIELQVASTDNIIERILYYWARCYTNQIKKR